MLKSLFGDLTSPKRLAPPKSEDDGFAATTIMETIASETRPNGQTIDRFSKDLVVSGSAAAAIREHFSSTRSDLETATRLITLIDPVRVWATLIVSTLSEACGQPIERLHLREQSTLRTLATIERTTVVRHNTDQLKVVHADVRAPGRENAEIQVALMEHSHMTAIIIGPMQAHAIDALLISLKEATLLPTWRCPTLLFMLSPHASWIQHKIRATSWPQALQVLVAEESMTSASAVWNTLVAQWRLAKAQQTWSRDALLLPATADNIDFSPSPTGGLQPFGSPPKMMVTPELSSSTARPAPTALQPEQITAALAKMSAMDGLLACALVNHETSQVLAQHSRLGQEINLERTACACAQLMRTHRQSAEQMGLSSVDEVTATSAGRQVMLRPVSKRPDFFMLALLDKQRTNLTLARLRLMELDKNLT